jgi:hypothetical protein
MYDKAKAIKMMKKWFQTLQAAGQNTSPSFEKYLGIHKNSICNKRGEERVRATSVGFGIIYAYIQIPTFPFAGCVTLPKLHNFLNFIFLIINGNN